MHSTIPLPTQNPAWGFWFTMDAWAADAWPYASRAIQAATRATPEAVRAFLDAREGRHFADSVMSATAAGVAMAPAIDAAIARWMTWRTTRVTAEVFGIPRGLPYLTGLVQHHGIALEAADAA